MKKSEATDDLRPEYDVSHLKGGVRGKYVERLKQGSNIIRLEQDVAAVFCNDQEVNEADSISATIFRCCGNTQG
jgi:hypothetical protein